MARDFSSTFIDDLANIIFTAEGIEQARRIFAARGLDTTKWEFPPTLSSSHPSDFKIFEGQMPLHVFTDCVFIPVMEMQSAARPEGTRPILAGFDVRYAGTNPNRTRYQKFKRNSAAVLFYNFGHYYQNRDKPVIVTEGVADLQTFLQTGLPITGVSPLTSASNEGLIAALYAMSDNIWFAYDNDEKGQKAIKQIQEHLAKDDSISLAFNFLPYLSKDPNQALKERGADYIKRVVEDNILLHIPPASIGLANKTYAL